LPNKESAAQAAPRLLFPVEKRSDFLEFLSLGRADKAVKDLVDLFPMLELFHVAEPAGDIRIFAEIDVDHLAERNEARAEIIGDRDLIAEEILVVRSDPVVVQDLEPLFRIGLAPFDRARMCFVAAALVMGEYLRVAEVIGPKEIL
jgi:hypothetical protein